MTNSFGFGGTNGSNDPSSSKSKDSNVRKCLKENAADHGCRDERSTLWGIASDGGGRLRNWRFPMGEPLARVLNAG